MTFIPCVVKSLPQDKVIAASETAVKVNPNNHPPVHAVGLAPTAMKLALVVGKRWPAEGQRLTVTFLDSPPQDLRDRILFHMNAWSGFANIGFDYTTDPGAQVRIARVPDGYWSYLGTDILHIPADEQTLNLQDFTMNTPESEFIRVVTHEAGHTWGFPHEHMRRTIVDRINPKKAIAYFMRTQGWSAEDVRQQVLMPLEAVKIKGSYRVDETSIMCYRLPGEITKSGRPIVGGGDLTTMDQRFASSVYPIPKLVQHN